MGRVLFISALICLSGCKNFFASKGEKDSNADADNPVGVAIYDSKDTLPKCTDDLNRALVYLKDEKRFYSCINKKWSIMPIEGERGDKGKPGDRGPSGVVNSNISGNWQAVYTQNVRSTAFIETKYEGPGCVKFESGSGFVAGDDLVATNGHVAQATHTDVSCGTLNLVRVRIWFPQSEKGDTNHNIRGSDGIVTKIDRSVAASDDTILLQVETGTRSPLTTSSLDEAADHLSGDGVKLGEEVLLIGYTGGTTFAHFATGRINAIQATGTSYLDSLISKGIIASGKIVYQYDLVSGAGASGSPVFSLNGEVIGLNFAGNSADADTDFGYAVQVKALRSLLQAPRNWDDL